MSLVRPENQLLLFVAQPNLDAASKELVRSLLGENLDWMYLMTVANRHGVVPLLQKLLGNGGVPLHVAAELQDWNEEICQFNLFLTGELVKLFDLFEKHGIRTIPFKGPTLTVQAHGDVGLRQYKDLDILVRKNDLGRVSELLADRGFKPEQDFTGAQQQASLRFGCATTFVDAGGMIVDVHWKVAEQHLGIQLDPDEFWNRLEPVNIGGRILPTLSAEDTLLVLCCHGYAHLWDRLGWIHDVAILIERRRDLDWNNIFNRARLAGMQRILLLGLLLAGELLHVALPPEATREIEHDLVVRKRAEEIIAQLFVQPSHSPGVLNSLARHLSMRERKRDKVRSFFAMFATPRDYDWMFVSAPTPLYYVVRPIRWVGTRVAKLWTRPNKPASPQD